jgi:ABC-type polar amino acid transport system ATPase subunit
LNDGSQFSEPTVPLVSPQQSVGISAHNLRKSFGDKVILNGLSFEVEPGSTHVIIGPSGGGKSTLLRSLAGLERIDSGQILVGGNVVQHADGTKVKRGMTRTQRHNLRQVGMIFQQFELFPHRTAVENVALPLRLVQKKSKDEAMSIAERELSALGLAEHASKRPGQLSGGQKQRVAIARALAMRPGVLLFDEPTSALDPELVSGVLAVMKELSAEGMTMVVVTHEMQFAAEAATTVMFVSGGDIVESGPPSSVIANPVEERTQRFLARLVDK